MLTSSTSSAAWSKAERENVRASTAETYRQTLLWLNRYRKNLTFAEIERPATVRGFLNFMADRELDHNTIHKHYKNLRKFVRLAVLEGYIKTEDDPTRKVKFNPKKKTKLFLESAELRALERLEIPADKPHWQPVRDAFLFSCYTGLRYSDLVALRAGNFLRTDAGLVIEVAARKTGKNYRQNLRKLFPTAGERYSRPEVIALRYLEVDRNGRPGLITSLTGQAFNRTLKAIFRSLPVRKVIKETVSAHVARHTCATELIRKGVSATTVQRLLRHSNIKETMIYVHLTGRAVDDELDSINW